MSIYSLGRSALQHPAFKSVTKPLRKIVKRYWEWKFRGDNRARLDHMQRIYFRKPIDVEHPHTLYDKLCYMEENTDVNEWRRLTDKVTVRDFVRERGLGDTLNEVYKVWDYMPSFDEFVAALPDQCVVKTNHTGGSEGVFIIRDKATANLRKVYKKLKRSFNDRYGERTGQQHYIGIKPCVMVEKLMQYDDNPDAPIEDYKFFCINGEPDTLNIISDRDIATHQYKRQYYDLDMNRYDWEGQRNERLIPKPSMMAEMTEVARKLAKGFPFVRVDLYEVNGKIIFGEMTFTPGFTFFIGGYADQVLKWGERIDLNMAQPLRQQA